MSLFIIVIVTVTSAASRPIEARLMERCGKLGAATGAMTTFATYSTLSRRVGHLLVSNKTNSWCGLDPLGRNGILNLQA